MNPHDGDPLTLPQTAGDPAPSRVTSAWLAWTAVSIVVGTVSSIALSLLWPHLETAVLTFGLGVGWSAATPRILRALGRWAHG